MSLTPKISGQVPLYFLVYSFVSGIILLFCSPLRFHLPPLFFISAVSPSEIWATFTSIILAALFLGTLIYLVRSIIVGNEGLNEKVGRAIRGRAPDIGMLKTLNRFRRTHQSAREDLSKYFTREHEMDFWKWVSELSFDPYLRFSTVLKGIVDSSLIGCEVVIIFFNWEYTIFVLFSNPTILIEVRDWLIIIPVVGFFLSYAYSKGYHNDSHRSIWNEMRCNFIGHKLKQGGQFYKQEGKQCFIIVRNGSCPIDKWFCERNELSY